MCSKSQGQDRNCKLEVLSEEGKPIILLPNLTLEEVVYWHNRITEMGEFATVTLAEWCVSD